MAIPRRRHYADPHLVLRFGNNNIAFLQHTLIGMIAAFCSHDIGHARQMVVQVKYSNRIRCRIRFLHDRQVSIAPVRARHAVGLDHFSSERPAHEPSKTARDSGAEFIFCGVTHVDKVQLLRNRSSRFARSSLDICIFGGTPGGG